MELIPFEYTRAAIYLRASYSYAHCYPSHSHPKQYGRGQRYIIHTFYSNPDDRRLIAAEVRRLRSKRQQEAA